MSSVNKLMANIKTTEINSVSENIIMEYEKGDWSSDSHLTGIFDQLKPLNTNLNFAINRIKAESDLEEKDELRDTKVRAIYYLIMGLIHHPDSAVSSSAQTVDSVFEHYGLDIVNKSFGVETSLIDSLLKDFANSEIQPSIAALPGLSELITQLQETETAFKEAQVKYEEEKAKEGTELSATEIKKEVIMVINKKLVIYLRAMVQVDEGKYGTFTNTVAQIIDDMNVIVKKRRKPKPTTEEGSEN